MSQLGIEMIEYITQNIMGRRDARIDENTPLVSSGLIDSLALVDIIFKLEELTNTRIPAGKVQAKDLDTIELMFQTANRVGKPRK